LGIRPPEYPERRDRPTDGPALDCRARRPRRDELNHSEAGKNYGWPIITYGIDHSGAKIGEGTAKPGMEQPVYYWDPVIAPSGIIFYTGDVFPDWKGSILVGSLNPGLLVRLTMKDGRVAREESYLSKLKERIREVRQGADGFFIS
jgi:aldose sugar dehydrogenase